MLCVLDTEMKSTNTVLPVGSLLPSKGQEQEKPKNS